MLKQTRNTSNKIRRNALPITTLTRLLPHAEPAAYSAVWAKKRDESGTYILFIGEMQQGRKTIEQEAGMEVCVRASAHSKESLFKNLCDNGGGRAASVLLHLGELERNINLEMKHKISKCSSTEAKAQGIFSFVNRKDRVDILPAEQEHPVNPCRSWRNPSRTARYRHGWWHQQNQFQRGGTPRMPKIHVSSPVWYSQRSQMYPSDQGWVQLRFVIYRLIIFAKKEMYCWLEQGFHTTPFVLVQDIK